MIEEFGLPSDLSLHFSSGNMLHEFREEYEPVVGAAVKRAFEERPTLLQEALAGPKDARGMVKYLADIAAKHSLTAAEYFFGLEPGYESLCHSDGRPPALLGMLLLRDEPVAHIRTLREMAEREHLMRSFEWGEVWRCRSASTDWFEMWTKHLFKPKHLATAIRLGFSSNDCFRFISAEEFFIRLGLRGVPLSYSLACGFIEEDVVVRAWEDGLPAEYTASLVG